MTEMAQTSACPAAEVPTAELPTAKPEPLELCSQAIRFTRHVYDTQQAVIRQLDVKAGVMFGILALLLTTTLSLAKDVPPKLHMAGKGSVTSWAFAISIFVFLSGFFWTACWVQATILPRHGKLKTRPGHMYALEILKHSDAAAFHSSIAGTSSKEFLESLTYNIYMLSGIADEKMKALRRAHLPIFLSLGAWIVSTILTLYISSWK
jgi:hypothetical protein